MNIIDKISSYDDLKLIAIEQNAVRLMETGGAAQKAQAEAVLAAISNERIRRNGLDYEPAADEEFDAVWLRIMQRMIAPLTVQNWGVDQHYTGGSFQVEYIGERYIRVAGGSMRMSRDVSRGDFAKVYRVWHDYCAGHYSRADLGKLSQNTTYILSVLKRVL